MQPPSENEPDKSPPPTSLRPELAGDEALLYEVYTSTRAEELALTNWDEPTRRAFLNQQFTAMRQGYRSMFPAGEFSIIEVAGKPAGRMVIDRGAKDIRVVDLALLPAYQNQGIGTWLMRQICAEADRPVRLSVVKFNRAFRWYERLGFTKVGELGYYDEMEWRPPVRPVSPVD